MDVDEGMTLADAVRTEPVKLAGVRGEAPTAVRVGDDLVVAWVEVDTAERESVRLQVGSAAPSRVSDSTRAWAPRLATGPAGTWLTWTSAGRIKLRKVLPELGPIDDVADGRNPAIAVGDDVHLAWETPEARIAVRTKGSTTVVSTGPFDRRPSIALGDRLYVAFDTLHDTHDPLDPDYDVRLWTGEGVVEVDDSKGLQAAPSIAWHPGSESLLVAYHSTRRHPIVKWWELRRFRRGRIEEVGTDDALGLQKPSGQQQGSELPTLAVQPAGAAVIATRSSHGARLQLVGHGVESLDLTRSYWGIRGLHTAMVLSEDGRRVDVVRRARNEVIRETITVPRVRPPHWRPARLGKPTAPPTPAPVQGAWFGDVHMHSAFSDGTGPPDELLARARARRLDFAVITEHDWMSNRLTPSERDEIAWITDWFDGLEGFATLHAWEWTSKKTSKGGSGHKNVYYRGRGEVFPYPDHADTAALHTALDGQKAFTAPHHASYSGTDFDAYDPAIERQYEIVSLHGSVEYPGNTPIPPRGSLEGGFATDGLQKGLRFGFLGGSDGHGIIAHHGIARKDDVWGLGLTGVVGVETPTRATLWDAMYARHTFATSGARVVAAVKAGDVAMGDAGPGAAPLVIAYDVRSPMPVRVDELAIVRDGETVWSETFGRGQSFVGTWTDTKVGPGAHSWYLRIILLRDGETVPDVIWTSPAFVTIDG